MALEPLKIIKRWLTNSRTREEVWDEIADKTVQWAQKTNNNLQQLGLDIDGADYQFNNNGRQTQTTPLVDRVSLLEAVGDSIGSANIGLDLSTAGAIRLVQSDGSDVTTTQPGVIRLNSTSSAGVIVSRNITTNLSLALQGCHWGFGGGGDLTDTKLYLLLIDTGSTVIFGVDAKGGRRTVTPADAETVATSVSTIDKVFVTSEPGAEYNCYYIGWVNANFDDTGNPGGEDYWTIQTGVGDVNLGRGETQSRNETIDGTLDVTGNTTLAGTLGVTGNTTITGTLTTGRYVDLPISTAKTRDIGLDVSTTTKIKIAWKDGTALSATQPGYVSFYSTSNAGRIVTRQLTASQEVTLTGAHWGLDTLGDLTDKKLYAILIDNGTTAILGVTPLPGLAYVATANCTTTSASATTVDHILTASAVSADANCTYLGWINADFDDTGNGGGENYWTIQTGVGDVSLGISGTRTDGEPFLRSSGTSVGVRGIAISSSSGAHSIAGTSYADVTNLSVTIKTTGRPVFLGLVGDGTSGVGLVGAVLSVGSSGNGASKIAFLRGSTQLNELMCGSETAVAGVSNVSLIPVTSFFHVDVVAAGTYTYKVQVKRYSGTSGTIYYAKLIAYEL